MGKKRKQVGPPSMTYFLITASNLLLALGELTPEENVRVIDFFCRCGGDHAAEVPIVKQWVLESIAAIKQAAAEPEFDGEAILKELDFLHYKWMPKRQGD